MSIAGKASRHIPSVLGVPNRGAARLGISGERHRIAKWVAEIAESPEPLVGAAFFWLGSPGRRGSGNCANPPQPALGQLLVQELERLGREGAHIGDAVVRARAQ